MVNISKSIIYVFIVKRLLNIIKEIKVSDENNDKIENINNDVPLDDQLKKFKKYIEIAGMLQNETWNHLQEEAPNL